MFRVTLFSPEQERYTITVSGLPEEQLDYMDNAVIFGEKDLYVYAYPKDAGEHWLSLRIRGGDVDRTVRLRVEATEGPVTGTGDDGVTGFITYDQSMLVVAAVAVIILAWIVTVVVIKFFVVGNDYNFEHLEYDKQVRRVSLQ